MSRAVVIALVCATAACGGGSHPHGTTNPGSTNPGTAPGSTSPDSVRHLYVVSQFDRAIYVYDIAADGALTGPSRTISGTHTGLTNPTSMMVDALGAVYVVNYQASVVVFSPGANGDATPQAALATDTYPIYIANNGPYNYALIANKVKDDGAQATTYLGTIYTTPVTTPAVSGTAFTTETPFTIPYELSIATSPNPNIMGDSVWTCSGVQSPYSFGAAVCYTNPVTSGPSGYLTSPQFRIPSAPNAVAFRADGALVVANQLVYGVPSHISTWRLPGEGDTTPPGAPLSSIQGALAGIVSPVHVFVDDKTNTLYVADTGNGSYQGSIKTWPTDADGNVAPTHVLSGLNYPFAVAVGP